MERSPTASRVRPLGVVGVVALLLLPGPAMAFDLIGTGPLAGASVQLSDDFELRYYQVDRRLPGFEDRRIHDYVEQVNRLNALLSQRWDGGGSLTGGLQIDQVALFSNRYILDGTSYTSTDLLSDDINSPWDNALIELEKGYLNYRWRGGDLTAGDTYASFGRGIALNLKKNTDIDIDTSIRGLKGTLSVGDTDLTLVSGITNDQQVSQDQPNLSINRDAANMVTGARVDRYGLGPANVGAHGVLYRFGRASEEGDDPWGQYDQPLDAVVGGASVELLGVGGIDWFLEGDLFRYLTPGMVGQEGAEDFTGETGHMAYLSASAYPGRTVVLVEAKHSADTERINSFVYAEGWEVATVPTLEYERVITEDSSAAVNSNDIYGGRVRVDYSAAQGLVVPYLSVMGLRDADQGVLHFNRSPETIVHPVAGFQWAGTGVTAQANTGLRYDLRDDRGSDGRVDSDRLVHFDGDISIPLGGHHHLELAASVKQFAWGENIQNQDDFLEMENALGWLAGEKWLFMVYQDYSDNPLVTSAGNISDKLYGAAEATWSPGSHVALKAFYGAYKAGIRCSGGQCRTLPGFEGARLSMTGSF